MRRAVVRGRAADLIEGGAARGQNLFHSFQEFSIQEGDAAYFANPTNILRILPTLRISLAVLQGIAHRIF
ncbi:hypothetical protein [Leptolyngbya sp. 7M]|uniref:two-partner secretion domain-containing protein n=1 Tax=Leptolyngbya sp. 7M TaxID=2812896 RepID=UPI00397768D9